MFRGQGLHLFQSTQGVQPTALLLKKQLGSPQGGIAALIVDFRLNQIGKGLFFRLYVFCRKQTVLQIGLLHQIPEQLGALGKHGFPL